MFASVNLNLHYEWIMPQGQMDSFTRQIKFKVVSYISGLQQHVFITLRVLTGYSIEAAFLSSVALHNRSVAEAALHVKFQHSAYLCWGLHTKCSNKHI